MEFYIRGQTLSMMRNFLLIAVLILAGCVGPYKIAKLEPQGSRTYWNWGRQYAIETSGEIEVRIAFENNTRSQLVFNIEIENFGNDTLLVAPELFYVEYFKLANDTAAYATESAVDPESMIVQLEKDQSQQNADEINNATSQLLEVSLEAASDIATLGQEQTQEEYELEQADRDRSRAYRAQENFDLKMNQMSLDERRIFYDETLLRKTSLPPNTRMTGQSYFWFDKNVALYRIYIPLGQHTLWFDFKQSILQN